MLAGDSRRMLLLVVDRWQEGGRMVVVVEEGVGRSAKAVKSLGGGKAAAAAVAVAVAVGAAINSLPPPLQEVRQGVAARAPLPFKSKGQRASSLPPLTPTGSFKWLTARVISSFFLQGALLFKGALLL